MDDKKKLIIRILLSILGTLAVLGIAVFCFYMTWEKAPDLDPVAPSTKPVQINGKKDGETDGKAFDTNRQDGIFTFLLVGNDDGTGNTDTIMVGKLDTNEHKIDVVSIPRDTLINVDWSVRKINSVYWGSKNSGGNGIDALMRHVKNITGFEPDCYAVIDLGIFIDVIDALGGVDFDVPVPMHYEDSAQNLYIHLDPGMQHLDGYAAMGLCRFRYGYANGDYGRIEMQQKFLKACAEQFITLGNVPNISKVVKILADGLDTNLSGANIAYFIRQALKCQPENINFHMVPSDSAGIGGLSYSVINLYSWIDMLNQCLNPFESPIGVNNLDIVYRNGGSYAATTTLAGDWYYNTNHSSGNNTAEIVEQVPEEPEGPTIIVVPSVPEQGEIVTPEETPTTPPDSGETETPEETPVTPPDSGENPVTPPEPETPTEPTEPAVPEVPETSPEDAVFG